MGGGSVVAGSVVRGVDEFDTELFGFDAESDAVRMVKVEMSRVAVSTEVGAEWLDADALNTVVGVIVRIVGVEFADDGAAICGDGKATAVAAIAATPIPKTIGWYDNFISCSLRSVIVTYP